MSKYRAKKITVDGITFDSRKEARRFAELRLLERAGKIKDLKLQVPFELLPAQYEATGEVYTRGKNKGLPKQGKCIEKAVVYRADFVYLQPVTEIAETNVYYANNCDTFFQNVVRFETVVEDTKGFKTKDYIIKRKLMLYVHGIQIREV